VSELVHRTKFQRSQSAATTAGTLLAQVLLKHTDIIRGASLVPIPLAPKRLKERGFNQAQLLADVISAMSGLPMLIDALQRTRETEAQTLLAAEERADNVVDAFAVVAPISGKKIVLIDDVATTGATLLSAARTLRLAHARPVMAAVFAASPFSPVCPAASST
jgi:ComF family protein